MGGSDLVSLPCMGGTIARACVAVERDKVRYHHMMVLEAAPPAATVKATLLRGSTLYMLGEEDAACRLFLWGVKQWPNAGEFHNNLGLCSIRCVS